MNETLTALIEAIDYHKKVVAGKPSLLVEAAAWESVAFTACAAASALRAYLARDAALEQYIGELRQRAAQSKAKGKATKPTALLECASRLEQIMKGEK